MRILQVGVVLLLGFLLLFSLGGCRSKGVANDENTKMGTAAGKKLTGKSNINIALFARDSADPSFAATQAGAEEAARSLSKDGLKVTITPIPPNGMEQSKRVAEVVKEGVDAIIISVADAAKVTPAINDAVKAGVTVITYAYDAPASTRLATVGVDDAKAGAQAMDSLAKALSKKGKIAILAGTPAQQARLDGAKKAAEKYPDIKILATVPCAETPSAAAGAVLKTIENNGDLTGWVMLGGWALSNKTLLDERKFTRLKTVAIDALPNELAYLDKNAVTELLGQPTYSWGKTAVEKVVDKLAYQVDVPVKNELQLISVTREKLPSWAKQLKEWNYRDEDGILAKYAGSASTGSKASATSSKPTSSATNAKPTSSATNKAPTKSTTKSTEKPETSKPATPKTSTGNR